MSKLRLLSAALSLGAVLVCALAGGCGPSQVETICDALCTCTPCTENDLADCRDSAEAAQQQSQSACAAPFAAYLTCAEDNISCRDPEALNNKCIAEISAMIRCDSTLAIIGTPCAVAQIKTGLCLGQQFPQSENQTCLGQQACIARCTIAASCAQIKDSFSNMPSGVDQPMLDCFTACSSSPGQ